VSKVHATVRSCPRPAMVRRGLKFRFAALAILFVSLASCFRAVPHRVDAQSTSIALGAYVDMRGPNDTAAIDAYAQTVGKMPAVLWTLQYWGAANNQFPASALENFRTRGIFPMINWQPTAGPPTGKTNQPDYSWTAIALGTHDAYITQWATAAKQYGHPFLVRMMHEMNGNWYPWGSGVNGNTNPADFVRAWQHVVDIFRRVGASNVQFDWCVNVSPSPDSVVPLYPGDNYVDWVSMDGYNATPRKWTSLYDKFAPTYATLTRISSKPVMISEVASVENPFSGQSKADWILQGFLTDIPQAFPRVKAVLWFNRTGTLGQTFTVDSSPPSLQAFRQVAANPLYSGSLYDFVTSSPSATTVLATSTSTTTRPTTPAPQPSPTARPAKTQFTVVSVLVQTNHRAKWSGRVKVSTRVHRGSTRTLAIYVRITELARGGKLHFTWLLQRHSSAVARHDASQVVKTSPSARYWAHWDYRFSATGVYRFRASVHLGSATHTRTITVTVS
jgi:hypothetical protein